MLISVSHPLFLVCAANRIIQVINSWRMNKKKWSKKDLLKYDFFKRNSCFSCPRNAFILSICGYMFFRNHFTLETSVFSVFPLLRLIPSVFRRHIIESEFVFMFPWLVYCSGVLTQSFAFRIEVSTGHLCEVSQGTVHEVLETRTPFMGAQLG